MTAPQTHTLGPEKPDLDRTEELPVLDIVAYEATLPEIGAEPPDSTPPGRTPGPDRPRAPVADIADITETDGLLDVERWIAAKTAELRALQEALTEARRAGTRADERVNSLTRELCAASGTVTTLAARLAELEHELGAQTSEKETVREQHAAAQTELTSLRDQLAVHVARATTSAGALEHAQAQLQDHVTRLGALEQSQQATSRERDRLADEARRTESALAERTQSEQTLKTSLTASERKSQELAAQLAQQTEQATRLAAELAEHEERLTNSLERLNTRERYRTVYETMFHDLDTQLDGYRGQNTALETRVRELTGTAASLAAKGATQATAITALEATAQRQSAALTEREAALASLSDEAGQLRATVAEQATRLEEAARLLEQNTSAHAEAIATLKAELEAGQTDRAELARRGSELSERLESTRSDLGRIQESLIEAMQRVAALSNAESEAAQTRDRLELVLAQSRERAASADSELATARTTIADLNGTVQRQQAQLAEQAQQLTERESAARLYEEERTAQLQLVSALREQVDSLTEELEKPDLERLELAERNDTLAHELATQNAHGARMDALVHELRTTVQRQREDLEDRDRQIRRLARLASSTTYALGRVQSSIDSLGTLATPPVLEAPSSGASVLTRIDGDHNESFVIRRRTNIGRAVENDLRLQARFVSRRHAVVIPGPQSARIEDLDSANGVIVNGTRVPHATLKHGDMVMLGMAEFRYTLVAGAEDAGETTALGALRH
jgi:DNA repair exonuclease SbcCD ATPase subunit